MIYFLIYVIELKMCFYFSDIDLVVVGLWDQLPLRTLERALLDHKIVVQEDIKVCLDRELKQAKYVQMT